jgi:hypothetical protein
MPILRSFALALAVLALAPALQAQDVPSPQIAMREMAGQNHSAGQPFSIDAYAEYGWEEVRLYDSLRAAELGLVYPYCISAVSREWDYPARQALDGKWVRVTGTLFARPTPQRFGGGFLMQGEADGLRFRNDCLGPSLLNVQSVEVLDQRRYAALDCIAGTGNLCVPPEWDQYWAYRGMTVRQPAPALDGPVTIEVETTDHFVERPVDGATRMPLGDYMLFFGFGCEASGTFCSLNIAHAPLTSLAHVEKNGALRRFYNVRGESPEAFLRAMERLRFCPVAGCASGPSVSLAELKAATAS